MLIRMERGLKRGKRLRRSIPVSFATYLWLHLISTCRISSTGDFDTTYLQRVRTYAWYHRKKRCPYLNIRVYRVSQNRWHEKLTPLRWICYRLVSPVSGTSCTYHIFIYECELSKFVVSKVYYSKLEENLNSGGSRKLNIMKIIRENEKQK